ncbi:MAG: metal-sensing transcriptional repressor [Clostridia bacterium]|nr:metal-sensing transcriptional repressor [Clostridia bacterium]
MKEHTCCQPTATRKTLRDDKAKTKLINRLARIEGQIRGIRKMIEEDAYCTDVLTQSAAAGAALASFNRELLDAHLHGCVARDLRAGEDSSLEELLPILQKLIK